MSHLTSIVFEGPNLCPWKLSYHWEQLQKLNCRFEARHQWSQSEKKGSPVKSCYFYCLILFSANLENPFVPTLSYAPQDALSLLHPSILATTKDLHTRRFSWRIKEHSTDFKGQANQFFKHTGVKSNFLSRNYQEFDVWKMWILWKKRFSKCEFLD